MLFSEPKISQSASPSPLNTPVHGFSALQRAENFSILARLPQMLFPPAFQCSSASRKFLNRCCERAEGHLIQVSVLFSEPKISQSAVATPTFCALIGFSALQRAENFSINDLTKPRASQARFSALQRAENFSMPTRFSKKLFFCAGFSALQRAENFSISRSRRSRCPRHTFQCSSASRKFLNALVVHPEPRVT